MRNGQGPKQGPKEDQGADVRLSEWEKQDLALAESKRDRKRLRDDGISSERMVLRRFVRSFWFNAIIYLVIAINTIIIALDDTWVQRNTASIVLRLSGLADWAILSVFTVEMLLKMTAFGLRFKPPQEEDEDPELYGYFALNWNRFDCFIVIMSWILVPIAQFSGANISKLVRILRLARPLRVLRQIRTLTGAQELVAAIPLSLPSIFDVLNLLLFCLLVFGILGLNLFGLEGKFHGRCVVNNNNFSTSGFLMQPAPQLCGDGWDCGEGFRCSCLPDVQDDGSIEERPYGYTNTVTGDIGCMRQGSSRPWVMGSITDEPVCPNFSFSCFDNFGFAVFTSFSSITLDSWSQTMFWAQDALSPIGGWIFFVLLVVIVSFNVMNLFVASMSNAYREVRTRRFAAENALLLEKKRKENKIRHMLLLGEMTKKEAARARASGRKMDQKKRGWLDELVASHKLSFKAYRNSTPLNPIAAALRQFTVYPLRIDECGNLVPKLVLRMAAQRNIQIKFGPRHGRWEIIAKSGGARMAEKEGEEAHGNDQKMNDEEQLWKDKLQSAEEEERKEERKLLQSVYQSGTVIAAGSSLGESRKELKDMLSKFQKMHDVITRGSEEEGTPVMDIVILICILLNTASAAVDHFTGTAVQTDFPYPPEANCCNYDCSITSVVRCPRGLVKMRIGWYDATFWTELVFNSIFTLEILVKMMSFWSVSGFMRDQFPSNIFDLGIVLISDVFFVLNIFLSRIFNVAVFRLVRLLRALRLATRLRRLRLIVNKARASVKTVVYVLMLMLFFHILAALVAMQILNCPPYEDSNCEPLIDRETILPGTVIPSNVTVCPRYCSLLLGDPEQCVYTDDQIFEHCPFDRYANFDSFISAILQLFYVTTGNNNWITTMSRGMRSSPTPWPGLFFFLIFYTISVCMICNLFISVILEEFELSDDEKEGLQVGQYRVKRLMAILKKLEEHEKKSARLKAQGKRVPLMDFNIAAFLGGDTEAITDDVAAVIGDEEFGVGEDDRGEDPVDIFFCIPRPLPDRHLLNARRNLRWYVHYIVNSRAFTAIILLTIVASSILLALTTPLRSENLLRVEGQEGALESDIVRYADYAFFGIFSVEFILKILLHGLYWEHKEAYFRQGWNVLDFTILVLQVLDFAGISGLKALRVLRVLRPLRLLNKIKSLQLMIMAIWSSATDIMNVLFLWAFGYIAFAVVGIYLFGGKLYSCSDSGFVGPPLNPDQPPGSLVGWRENCVGNVFAFSTKAGEGYVSQWSSTGVYKPRVWENPDGWDFDNFAQALQTLFEASTLRHWSYYVVACSDATNIGQHPIRDNNRSIVIFFILWIVLSCFFLLQMMIGVLIDAINQRSGTTLLTYLQRNWIRTEQKIMNLQPLTPIDIPQTPLRNFTWMIVNHPAFQNTVTLIIITNIVFMATESYNQPEFWSGIMVTLNWVFIVIYVIEILLKLVAYLHLYFYDPWNLFDLFVVLASVIDEILSAGGGSSGLQALRVLRILRVARALRLVRRNPRLKLILNTFAASIPAILSIMTFMALFVFLFAIVANQFFAGLKHGVGVSRRNNFDTSWDSLLAMFVVITGDEWQRTMRDVAIQAPSCTSLSQVRALREQGLNQYFPDPSMDLSDCGSAAGAYLFFDIFFFIGYNVLRAAFIAVLMENFFAFKVSGTFMITDLHFASYQRVWRQYDSRVEGRIETRNLRDFVEKMAQENNPLGAAVLQNEFRYNTFRVELTHGKETPEWLEFTPLLHTLGMHTVGVKAFQYEEMLARKDKVTWYGQIAACQKMVTIYRRIKEQNLQNAKAMGVMTSGAMAALTLDRVAEGNDQEDWGTPLGAEGLVRSYRSSAGKTRRVQKLAFADRHAAVPILDRLSKKAHRSHKPPVPPSTVSESSVAKIAPMELDKHVGVLEGLLRDKVHVNGNGKGHSDGNGSALSNGNGHQHGNGTNHHIHSNDDRVNGEALPWLHGNENGHGHGANGNPSIYSADRPAYSTRMLDRHGFSE